MDKAEGLPQVLVVDDEPIILETFKAIFEGHFEVLTAACGRDALDEIAENSINLVFLDLSIPDMSGMRILAKIKEQDNNLPVIIITGNDNQAVKGEAKRLGAIDYIDKPFDIEQVLDMAYKTLNKNK